MYLTGYRGIDIEHRREVRLSVGRCEVEVTDRLEGGGGGEAEVFFHFAPEVHVTRSPADNGWIAERADCDHRLMLYTDPLWQFERFRASTDPVFGWYSPALEEKLPATTLRGRAALSMVRRGVTRIVREGR